MTSFTKTVRLGTTQIGRSSASVYARIEFKDGKLSICGVEGPTRGGNARGGCGQIVMSMDDRYVGALNCAPGWDRLLVRAFLGVWRDWHLNDMQAGTPEQTAILKANEFPGYPASYYTWACGVLEERGMLEHNGYRYGTAWLKKEIPPSVLEFLRGLPDTDKTPAWV